MTRPVIGVLVKRFPKLSETFILNEVLGLEARGQQLHIFALEPPSDEIENPAVSRVKAPVDLVTTAQIGAWIRQLAARPLSFVSGCVMALREFGLRDSKAVSQALALAGMLRKARVAHLHAHFADRPAAIARTACAFAGLPFSVSAHAKDIYVQSPEKLAARLRGARFTVTCTGHNAVFLRKLAPEARVKRLYHGIDTGAISREGVAPSSEPPLILGVGRLRPKKGFDTLVSACAILATSGRAFRCVIAGYGPDHDRLVRQIADSGLETRIQLLGKLPHDEIISLMQQARVLALPCRIEEDGDRDGIPNVLLEAMAAGTPVVSTTVSGIPEVVRDGETGLLAPPNDPSELARALARVLDDHELSARLSRNGRALVEERFSLNGDIAVLDGLLREAVGPPRPAGTVGYILKGFPRLSESFISNEIRLLERNGLRMHVFAIKTGDELGEQALAEISTPVTYLPPMTSLSGSSPFSWFARNLPPYAGSCIRLLLVRPLSFQRTLTQAIRMSSDYRDAKTGTRRYVFLKEFLQAAYIADKASGARNIAHLHGHFCHGATTVTRFVGMLLGKPFSFTAHAKDIYEQKLNPGDLLDRKFDSARFAVTCTAANHEHLRSRGIDCSNLHTIYHGLDTSLFSPVDSDATNAAPIILAVGRYVEKKGFLDLIAACAQLQRRGVSFEARIVGEEGDAGPAMRNLIERHGLQNVITLTPPAPQHELRDIYARATVFALPCRIADSGDRDGIPNVLAEAMAMELPVVTTDVSGIPELVHHKRTGLLVKPGDPDGLAVALEDILMARPETRAALGRAARAIIKERFDSQTTTLSLKALFDQALVEAMA